MQIKCIKNNFLEKNFKKKFVDALFKIFYNFQRFND